jgi:hypothetical protein
MGGKRHRAQLRSPSTPSCCTSSHHASSKGFVNDPYFKDQQLSWKFDECVTEHFTKKVWNSKYSDKADELLQYSNYFKNESGKKGWYG